jgi:glucose-1-phosphate thymidylyltransferase
MKGVILAGGTGSRLYPLTKVTNKHLLPVGLKPMIYYPIEKLTESGIRQILIVTGTEHMGSVVSLLGSGRDFGCHFTYKVQDEAGGIAQALGLAEDFAQEGPLAVILGDNLFEDSLVPMVQRFREDQQERGARIALKEVPDPHRFGVATLEGDRVVKIVEKPKQPESHWAVTGVYLYDGSVFEAIHTLRPSGRGELEITDVNNAYITGGEMGYDVLKGWWSDAGTFESLARANHFVLGEGA